MQYEYSPIQKWLHWIIAILVIAMIPAGLIFTDFDNKPAIEGLFGEGSFNMFYDGHKSMGFLILFLMILRLLFRAGRGSPPYRTKLTPFEKMASGGVHVALYVLLFAVPILGWAGTGAFPAPLPVFGLFDMPPILAPDRELSQFILGYLHGPIALLVAALAAMHIGAALYHGIVKRDGVMSRMRP